MAFSQYQNFPMFLAFPNKKCYFYFIAIEKKWYLMWYLLKMGSDKMIY